MVAGRLVVALTIATACSRPAHEPATYFGRLSPGIAQRAILAQLPEDNALEFAGMKGKVSLVGDPAGQMRGLSWDVRRDTRSCGELIPAAEASLKPDFAALRVFPKWSVDLAGVRRTCEGDVEGSRAIRLCCAEVGGSPSPMTFLSITLAFRDAGGLPDLSQPTPQQPPSLSSPPWHEPAVLPAISTAGLPPVELGACRICPPADERIASPVVLEINREPCGEGICPGYQIRAHRDGTVEFMGRSDVRAPSYCVAHIDANRLDRVLQAAAALEHIPPGGSASDSSGVVVTARIGSKEVTRRSEDEGEPLFPLAAQLEAALELSAWSAPPPTATGELIPATKCRDLPKRWTYPWATTPP